MPEKYLTYTSADILIISDWKQGYVIEYRSEGSAGDQLAC